MWNTDPVIVVGVLVCLNVIAWLLCAILAVSLRAALDDAVWLRGLLRDDGKEIVRLRAQLREAQRNDHRDAKGRYASLEDVCVPPGNYPTNR